MHITSDEMYRDAIAKIQGLSDAAPGSAEERQRHELQAALDDYARVTDQPERKKGRPLSASSGP